MIPIAGRPRVPSPCVQVCRLDASGQTCTGCLRTIDEITAWGAMDDAGRERVWQALAARGLPAAIDRCGRTGPAPATSSPPTAPRP